MNFNFVINKETDMMQYHIDIADALERVALLIRRDECTSGMIRDCDCNIVGFYKNEE